MISDYRSFFILIAGTLCCKRVSAVYWTRYVIILCLSVYFSSKMRRLRARILSWQ